MNRNICYKRKAGFSTGIQYDTPFHTTVNRGKRQKASKLQLQQYVHFHRCCLNTQQYYTFQRACSAELSAITLMKHLLLKKQSLGSLVMLLVTNAYQLLNQHGSQCQLECTRRLKVNHKIRGNHQDILQPLTNTLEQNLLTYSAHCFKI